MTRPSWHSRRQFPSRPHRGTHCQGHSRVPGLCPVVPSSISLPTRHVCSDTPPPSHLPAGQAWAEFTHRTLERAALKLWPERSLHSEELECAGITWSRAQSQTAGPHLRSFCVGRARWDSDLAFQQDLRRCGCCPASGPGTTPADPGWSSTADVAAPDGMATQHTVLTADLAPQEAWSRLRLEPLPPRAPSSLAALRPGLQSLWLTSGCHLHCFMAEQCAPSLQHSRTPGTSALHQPP